MIKEPYDFETRQLKAKWSDALKFSEASIIPFRPMSLWKLLHLGSDSFSTNISFPSPTSAVDIHKPAGETLPLRSKSLANSTKDRHLNDFEDSAVGSRIVLYSEDDDHEVAGDFRVCDREPEHETSEKSQGSRYVDADGNTLLPNRDCDCVSGQTGDIKIDDEEEIFYETRTFLSDVNEASIEDCSDYSSDAADSTDTDELQKSGWLPIRATSEDAKKFDVLEADLRGELGQLHNDSADLEHFSRILNPEHNLMESEMALINACGRGFMLDVLHHLSTGVKVSASGGLGGNALEAASRMGHMDIVEVLLQETLDVNQTGGVYGNALQAAAAGGHLQIVEALLLRGATVNASGGLFDTAVHAALYYEHDQVIRVLRLAAGSNTALSMSIQANDENTVRALLESGWSANVVTEGSSSPLHMASAAGLATIVELLLQSHADHSRKDDSGRSPLFVACTNGHEKVVEILLENGAGPNARAGMFQSDCALLTAAKGGQENMVRMLLENGAKDSCSMFHGDSALCAASHGGFVRIVEMLLETDKGTVNSKARRDSALRSASQRGHIRVVQKLLNDGADSNQPNGPLGNALNAATTNGHDNVVELLIRHGANVNENSGYCGTALLAASSAGHLKVVRMLLKHKANVNASGGMFESALYAAAAHGHTETARILIKAEANGSALHRAASIGNKKAILCLLRAGMSAHARGPCGESAFVLAARNGNGSVVQWLMQDRAALRPPYGKRSDTLYAAASMGHRRVVRMLVEGDASSGALCIASQAGEIETVQLLLQEGVKVDNQRQGCGSALYLASLWGHEKLVRALLKANADVQLTGGWFGNPLQAASAGGHDKVVEILLEGNADIKCRGGHYGTALQAACAGSLRRQSRSSCTTLIGGESQRLNTQRRHG